MKPAYVIMLIVVSVITTIYFCRETPMPIQDNTHIIDSLKNEIKKAKGRVDTIEIEIIRVITLRDTIEKEIERYTPEQVVQAWDSLTAGEKNTELTEVGVITDPGRIRQGVQALALIPSLNAEIILLYDSNDELKGIINTQDQVILMHEETIQKKTRQNKIYRVAVVTAFIAGLLLH
jgi:hypothetical protein